MKRSDTQEQTVSGLVERVTFFNEETGFAVLKVAVKGARELVTVVGSLAAVSAGEWLVAEGLWVRAPDHGMQLKAGKLRTSAPSTREGIEKYLGSGMVKGIGPVYAKKLVERFGDKIFEVIEQYSARLEEVAGIGPERRRKIKTAWAEQKKIREIMVFLHSHGVGTSRAVRIYKTYGDGAIEKIRANPYVLAQDIAGIGFKTADQIAGRVGIEPDSILRAEAGLVHVLWEHVNSGHCAYPRDGLREESAALLGVPVELIDRALDRILGRGEAVRELCDGNDLIFLPKLHRAEIGIAEALGRFRESRASYPPIDIEKALAWCAEKTGQALAAQQEEALRAALADRMVIITGGPGVGKTTLLRWLLMILKAKRVRCLLCAPTGRAAKRLAEAAGQEAKTIHRMLEWRPGEGGFTRNERSPLECDLLVIDEASMIDVPLMHQLLRAVPPGAGVVVVGDADQLPSVGPGMLLSHLIQSGIVRVAELTEVFRQAAQSRIVSAAHRINRGEMPELPGRDELSDFYFIERESADDIAGLVVEMVKDRIPRKYSLDLDQIQVLSPMNRSALGVQGLNRRLQEALNPARADEPVMEKFGWQLRIRDRVIQMANNYDKDVFNGDIGQVTAIDREEGVVAVRFEQRIVAYEVGELDELQLAYAITVHKSQGSEFPAVVIPLATQHYMLLQRNLVYTAITRGRKLVVVIGQKRALRMALQNNRTLRRHSGLLARLRGLGDGLD